MAERVNHPDHYNWIPNIEAIDVAKHFNFFLGNVVKYIWRAPVKETSEAIVDLNKAIFYLTAERDRLVGELKEE